MPSGQGRKISGKDIVKDVRAGLDDVAIAEKYGISEQKLKGFYDKLTAAGALKPEDLTNRSESKTQPSEITWRCPSCGVASPRAHEECPRCGIIVSKFDAGGAPPYGRHTDWPESPPVNSGEESTELLGSFGRLLGRYWGRLVFVGCGLAVLIWLLSPSPPKDPRLAQLIIAAQKGNIETVRELVSAGVNVNGSLDNGGMALDQSAITGQLEVVQFLLDNGADVNAQGFYGQTALIAAAGKGHADVVQLLLERGADVHIRGDKGQLCIVQGAAGGTEAIVRMLLDAGAEINAQGMNGQTALFMASFMGRYDMVTLLLDRGADVNLANDDGYTPLAASEHRGRRRVSELLRSRGGTM